MAWLPTSNTPLQYMDENGDPYSGAVLKFYEAGTSTNIAVATAQAGTPTVTSVALNSDGYPEVSGNTVVIFVDQDYKVAMYPTQAAADSNTGALWTIDNIDPFAVLTLPTNLTDINALTPSDGNVIVGDGTEWVAESGNTARTSLGLGTGDSPQFTNVTLSGLTTGHVVLANSAGALTALNVTTKGSLIVGDGAGAPTTLAVGANTHVLTANSGATNGIEWAAIPNSIRDYQQITSSGTWTNPGGSFTLVEAWGGGGGGANNTWSSTGETGGGGGEYVWALFATSTLGATETVTIGAGGAGAANASTADGSTGGTTTFGSWLSALGGNPGKTGAAGAYITVPRSPAAFSADTALGVFVLPQAGMGFTGAGGKTVYGGGGGGGSNTGGSTGGTSEIGGDGGGGNNTLNTAGTGGAAPAGGGGGSGNNGGGGAGARGEVRVWTW